ncbi:hypothetical protein [Actinosynnema mirum]|uniref:Uncharacterized protein n=1 Tax=Actinosynnema mirum (strain ATCC 29888 / DSM 43827 / JCM 3225 / NBRC 14064 / NCIMB 13271 / NRRL B-12336 / IMRU 3971 / 101) TaxID=446462 RepID=C6WQ11_ACTMD|nr:hypothetical protein [Actinosynnema mirum]ACU35067.1 hypothetical protein Amir_1111 [Actinosynnema mirum DSM 43827]
MNRAEQRYANLVGAIDFVTEQLPPLDKLIARMRDNLAPAGSWQIASPDELKKMLNRARKELTALKELAARYEIELKTREWKA